MKRLPRPYRQAQRREQQEQTRRRIVEAVVALHEEVGPARTTVKGIAERAGVERLTVYRHFPDEAALLDGCSAHWRAGHPPPDPAGWAALTDPRVRAERVLTGLYAWYAANAVMLASIHRDLPAMAELRRVSQPLFDYLDGAARQLGDGRGDRAAVCRTVTGFAFWQALKSGGATTRRAQVRLALAWLEAVGAL